MNSPTEPGQVRYPLLHSDGHHDHAYFEQLKRRLRLRLSIVFMVPLLVLSAFFHFQYNRTVKEGIDNHLRSIAENRRNTVDLFLQERVANLRNVFREEVLPILASGQNMDRDLGELRRESSTFVDLGLFRSDGALVAYSGPHPSLTGKDYSGEKWFREVQAREQGYFISDVYLGFRGKPHFIVAVRRANDEGLWILRASVDPEKFGEFVSRSYLLENAEAFIVNAEGQHQTFSSRVAAPKVGKIPARSSDTEVAEIELEGKEYVRAVAWLTGNEWALVVRVPTSEAYASLNLARIVLGVIVLLALAVITFVIMGFSRKLVGRLEAADSAKESLREQLFSAAKLASVGEIAAGVAHEINNPLAIIYEEAAMMLDIMDPQFGEKVDLEEFSERLGAIKEATMRGRSITKKLLAFSRKHEPDPKETDINVLIDRVLEVKKVDFSVSNIEVDKEFEEGLPAVMVNRNQMDQVILNLLNNAKDAIKNDGRITIRTMMQGGWVRIEVTDTGAGMPPEVMKRIFFPFFTTKPVGKGTGLGLSISYGIIESFGGRIQVKSTVGKGTTFILLLPVPGMQEERVAGASQLVGGGDV